MQVGRRDEGVDPAAAGRRDGPGRAVDVPRGAAGQGGHDRALERLRDPPDRLRVGLRRDGEAGLDDVHPQRLEQAGHLDFLVDPEGEPGRLFAVPEGGVEHDQSIHRGRQSPSQPAQKSKL